jgi:hypothetical protein
MAEGVFGKAGQVSFSTTKGNSAVVLAPYALVSLSVYSTTPTDAEIADDANSLATAVFHTSTAWTNGASSFERLIAIDAIDDPEPTSSDKWEKYFAVVRYRLDNGGQIQRDTIGLIMHRAKGVSSRFGVGASDLDALERTLDDLLTSSQIQAKIDLAETLVKQRLQSKGMDLRRLDWASAKDLVRYLACSLCCQDLSNGEDGWQSKSDFYYKHYELLFDSLALGYDSDDDGAITPEESASQGLANGFLFR